MPREIPFCGESWAAAGDLGEAALSVRHDLEALAREHPQASAPALVLLLARRYCPAWLRRRWR
jgi:hypothetical protein